MPTYSYACSSCGAREDAVLSMSQRESLNDTPCPHCAPGKLRVQFTPNANVLVTTAFRRGRNWGLPPKDSPDWANMQREGTGRKSVTTPDLKDDFRKAGLIR